MKRLLSLTLALCLMLGLCGCQVITQKLMKTDAAEAGTLYEHGMELAELLEEMLRSPEYFEMMGGSDRLGEAIAPLMRASLAEPESAYLISLPPEALFTLISAAEVDMDQFSGGLRDFMERRMINSVPSILNSRQGAETLAAASILTVSDAWAGESLETGCYLILSYPDVCPVMVSFCGDDGVVTGTATLLIGEPLEEDSAEGVSELFAYLGIDGLNVEELEID